MDYLDITGISRVKLLAALHNGTKALGMGRLHDLGRDMTDKEAQEILEGSLDVVHFDYVHGRPIKVQFVGSTQLRGHLLYDRDAGEGVCARIVERLRKEVKNITTEIEYT